MRGENNMSGGIRIKLKDGVYISLIQVSTHEKNILGVEGIREKGSIEAVLISVDKYGNSKGMLGQVVRLSDASKLVEFINMELM
tara:strand:+ start:85 stop:336 length:252 start_codon:yes stop_codon:yes gene_type:complete